jgi:hypothetical protein
MSVRIEGWKKMPVTGGHCLVGFITGHPDPDVGQDGSISQTSVILEEKGGKVKTQSGTWYVLGEPA